MKKVTRLLSLFIALLTSIGANSTPFHPSEDGLVKKTFRIQALYPTPKENQYTGDNETAITPDRDSSINLIDTRYKAAIDRLKQQAASVKEYAKANHFSMEYCFLVDMSVPSGKKRFFVYNMKKDSLEYSSLVAHGAGSYIPGNDQLEFSNNPNSFKTSLGKYKIGHSYYGTFGLAYKLYGLDSTNSKAFDRAIVLHSLSHVPDSETYPDNICVSAGCPMVSAAFLVILDKYIKSSPRPVLMWVYN